MVLKMETARVPQTVSSGIRASFTSLPLERATFACEFLHHGCPRQAIFDETYLRTNRTNHTKIMRCFPHCCPDHRNRSYCGSPISVRLSASTTRHATNVLTSDELVIYGRFRPWDAAQMTIGDRINAAQIETSLQSNDPSQGEWIESVTSRDQGTSNSWIFQINPEGRWYYPWSGAATIAMRTADHIFEALAFRRVTDAGLELVAQTASPTFRLMSFRRGSNASTLEHGTTTATGDVRIAIDYKRLTTGDNARKRTPTQRLSPELSHMPRRPPPSRPSLHDLHPVDHYNATGSQSLDKHLRDEPQSLLSHQSADQRTEPSSPINTLCQLLTWLQEIPARCVGSRLLLTWERTVMAACDAHLLADQSGIGTDDAMGAILSALEHPSADSHLKPGLTDARAKVSPLDAVDAAVQVVLNEWLGLRRHQASRHSIEMIAPPVPTLDRAAFASEYATWVTSVERRAECFLEVKQSRVNWSDLVALAKTVARQQPDRSVDSGAFGYRDFVAQCRQQIANKHHQDTSEKPRHAKRRRMTPSDLVGGCSGAAESDIHELPCGLQSTARAWISGIDDVAIDMDFMAPQRLPLAAVLHWWQQLSCIRLDMCGASHKRAEPQLSVASVFNVSAASSAGFTRLILDGQYRWFQCLPNGDATTGSTVMGFIVGDYVGHVTSAGMVHVTTFLWPERVEAQTTTATNRAHAYAWHWTLDTTAVSRPHSAMVLSATVETARVREVAEPLCFETMSITEKLLSVVDRWDHVAHVKISYRLK